MDQRCIELVLRHQRCCTFDRALAFAANPVKVDIVRDDMAHVDERRFVRECTEADAATAINELDGVVNGVWSTGTLEDVVDPAATAKLGYSLVDGLAAGIDDMIRTELASDLETLVDEVCQDHRVCAKRFGHGDSEQPDRACARDYDALAGDEPAEDVEPIHRRAGCDDKRCSLVTHAFGHSYKCVDVVDGILRKRTVRRVTVRTMTFIVIAIVLAVVQARCVHAFAATLAAATARMNLHGNAFTDRKLIDIRPELDDRTHELVSGREVLVEGQLAFNHGRQAVVQDFQIRATDSHGIYPD